MDIKAGMTIGMIITLILVAMYGSKLLSRITTDRMTKAVIKIIDAADKRDVKQGYCEIGGIKYKLTRIDGSELKSK